jgi:hypothetical protein
LDPEAAVGISISSCGLTSGEKKSADEFCHYMLAELKAHKDAKKWLLTATLHEKQRTNHLMLTNINSYVAGKSICCFSIYFFPKLY